MEKVVLYMAAKEEDQYDTLPTGVGAQELTTTKFDRLLNLKKPN
jgi:hypothetical protein